MRGRMDLTISDVSSKKIGRSHITSLTFRDDSLAAVGRSCWPFLWFRELPVKLPWWPCWPLGPKWPDACRLPPRSWRRLPSWRSWWPTRLTRWVQCPKPPWASWGGMVCVVSSQNHTDDFLVVQWLRLCLPLQGLWVLSLVGELRFHMPQGVSRN